jgi:hypothetical protein
MSRLKLAVTISVGCLGLLVPGAADAHFMLMAPASWWSQAADGSPQKTAPCGEEGATGTAATGTVNVYQSGQPVAVTVMSTVAHPGWWRISLRQGAAATQNGTTFPDPTPMGAAGTTLQCTPAFINNPVWSPTQPVLYDKLGLPAGSTSTTMVQSGMQTFQVTIPSSAQCSNASPCTLQVLMIMTDHPAASCNYHHCANMAMAGTTSGTGGTTGAGDAGASDGGTGAGGAKSGTGGTTIGPSGTGGATTGAGGTAAGVGGATAGVGGAAAGIGGATAGVGGAATGAGGSTGAGHDGSPDGGEELASNGCSCGVAGGAMGSWSGALFLAALALRRRRGKK